MLRSLGETVYIDGAPIDGVFDSVLNDLDFDRTVDSADFSLTVLTTDLEDANRDSIVSIRDKEYVVVQRSPDDEGLTVLNLVLA